jgi:hypothetical protein
MIVALLGFVLLARGSFSPKYAPPSDSQRPPKLEAPDGWKIAAASFANFFVDAQRLLPRPLPN